MYDSLFSHNCEIMTHQLNEFVNNGEIIISPLFFFKDIISHSKNTIMNTHKLINYYE